MPRRASSVFVRPGRGHAGEQAGGVRVTWTGRRTSRTVPCSTISPAYSTATRSHIRSTSPRSWVMNSDRRRQLAAQVGDQRRGSRARPSRRARSSVRRGRAASVGWRAPWRSRPVAAGRPRAGADSGGRSPAGRGSRRGRAVVSASRCGCERRALDASTSAIWAPTRIVGLSAACGSWYTMANSLLHQRRSAGPAADRRRCRRARSARAAGGGRERRGQRQRDRALAAARLADEPEGLAGARP